MSLICETPAAARSLKTVNLDVDLVVVGGGMAGLVIRAAGKATLQPIRVSKLVGQ